MNSSKKDIEDKPCVSVEYWLKHGKEIFLGLRIIGRSRIVKQWIDAVI